MGVGSVRDCYSDRNKIRFQINPGAATRAGLTLSAKLLRLSEIVDPEDKR
ncbi:MAG TPA: hypothetical protein DIC52_23575 [Candidatus Latescibacteria bacterium]|nr:hypothetical protein [Candidatus Latescibacterota bacterium]